jgi:hypothetical protein
MNMKALPKLMKNSALTIYIVSEEMPDFTVTIIGSTSWPSVARLDTATQNLRFFDCHGNMIHESPGTFRLFHDVLPNFGLVFIGVTESTVDFKTKSQTIVAKMRAINLDDHENLHGDNFGYDE